MGEKGFLLMDFYSVFDDSCHFDQNHGGIFTIFEVFSPKKEDPPRQKI